MKAYVPHSARLLVLSAAIATLASCGGGGGGGGGGPSGPPSSNLVALTAANMKPVTEDVLNMTVGSFVSVGASNSSTIGEVPLSVRPPARPRTSPLIGLLRQQLGALGARSPMASGFVPLDAVPVNCDMAPDGSTGTETTDSEPTMSSITLTFVNCFSGGETIDGTLSLTNMMQPAANEFTGHVSHSLKFVQSGLPDLATSGDFDIDHKTDGNVITDTLTGTTVNVSIGPSNAADNGTISGFTITSVFDKSSSDETNTVAGTVATTVIGGAVTVTTPTPLQIVATSKFQNTGQLIITGASNSAVRFTVLGDENAVGDQVTLEVDPEGDGTFQPPVGMKWVDL